MVEPFIISEEQEYRHGKSVMGEEGTKRRIFNVEEALVGLFEDLIRDILLRLPWQSVTRFKSVSKNWLRLLSEPSFIHDYQSRNFILLGFLHTVFKRVNFVPFPLLENPIYIRDLKKPSSSSSPSLLIFGVANLSNGLVLCCYSLDGEVISHLGSYIVYNPITEEQLHLPPQPRPLGAEPSDGQRNFLVIGFAFHHASETPYFIVTELVNRKNCLQVNIFSSETFQWISKFYDLRPMFGGDEDYALSGPSTFYRGSFHWVSEPLGIVSFSLKKLQFTFRKIPANGDDPHTYHCMFSMTGKHVLLPPHCRCRYLGECLDKLIYIQIAGNSQLYLWKLDDYCGGKWSERQSIIIENVPMPLIHCSIVGFDRRDDQVFFLKLHRMLLSYHLRSKELTMLHEVPPEDYSHTDLNFFCAYELPTPVPFLFYMSFSQLFGTNNVVVSNQVNFPE